MKRRPSDTDENQPRGLIAEQLEPRILYSASPAAELAPEAETQEVPAASDSETPASPPSDVDAAASPAPTAADSISDEALLDPETDAFDAENQTVYVLQQEGVETIAAAAADRWEATGLSQAQQDALASITYRIGDLGGYSIGQTDGNVITIDDDAAGLGWFFDTTPDFDEEFEIALGDVGTSYLSDDDDAASRAIDLLSVILHEQGHILGLEDLYDNSLTDGVMYGVFEVGERSLASCNEAEGAEALSLVGPQYATVDATWTGAGDGTSWNDAANWNGTAPSTVGILTIDTPATIDNVFLDGTTNLYDDGETFRGIVNLDQGTIDIGHYFGTGSNNGSQGVFNIGDGSGTGDAIVNISDGGQWEFDRHSNGTYTINIASDGELNATGTGFFDTYATGNAARGWAINVNGGKLTSEGAWTMNDNGGNTHPITISNGGQVNLGVINLVGEVIDFADADAGNSFTAAFGGSFADIDAVNAAIGTTFTSTGGEPIFVQDNGGTFTVNFNAPPVFVNDTDLADNTINENALVDAPVGITASFSDPEGATLTYSLRDDAGGRFKIDSSTGVVSVANPALLSFAGAASHDITVEASDGTTGIGIEDFTIAVTLPAWTGDGDGTSWNDAANWGGTAPGQTGTLIIDTTDTLTNLYRDTGTVLYNNGATFRGTANLNQGTIELDHYFGTGPSGGGFNIGDGSGTADAIVNVVDGGTWEFDRHSGGTYTININSDGQLNATGTGKFQTYANTPTRQWVINVDGGTLTSEADWNMRGNGSDDNQVNIFSGATVDLGAIFLENTVINFSDANADNSFTAAFNAGANSFADIAAVNAAIGTTFTTSAVGVFVGATDNGDGTFSVNAAIPTLSPTDIVDDRNGSPILAAQPVTYTLNFSHGMDLSTITADDFENAGSATITIDSISQGANGEVTVVVTPGVGDLQLQIKAGTDIRDSGGNALDTTAAITDDTTISVVVNFSPVAADDINTATEAGGFDNKVTVVGGDGTTVSGTSGTVFEQVGTELSLTPPTELIQGSIRNDGGNDTEAHLAALTSDTFTYDPLDPTSDLPTQGYDINAVPPDGMHGNTNGDVIIELAVDSPVTIDGQTQVVVDLYGRNGNRDRDNDIDILFIAADGSVLGQVNGQAINAAGDHLRVSSQGFVAIGSEIAAIRIVGHDSDSNPAAGNAFTLMEVRAAVLVGDTDADSTDQAVPHDGTVNVTHIAYTGTPFQNTNTGGAVVGATSIDGQYGTLTINPDGTYTYLLDADASDPLTSSDVVNEVFTYTIEDGNEDGGVDMATATLTIAITGADDINLPPVAVDDTNTATEAGGTGNSDTTFGGDGATASGTSGTVFEQTGSVIGLTAPTALDQGSLLLLSGNTEADYLASILNDTFAFDPLDPTAATPQTFYSTGANATGLHGAGNGDIIFTMTVDSPVTIDGDNQVVVDLYGRNQNQFRDNDIDVLFLAADGVTILGQVNEVAISDTGVPHVRVSSAGVVATGAVIGQIRIVGHDSDDDPASGNAFTLMEMRASEIIGDYDPNVSDQTVPHDGTVNVTNIAFTGTPFQATNAGGTVSGDTAIDGQYGTLTINPDGTYVYLLDPVASDSLTSSDVMTEEFTYTIEDGNEDGGADSTATLTITVTGADDTPAPPVAIDDTDSVTEAGGVGNATETVGGDGSTPSGTSGTVFPGPGGPLVLQNPTIERGGNAFGGTIEGTLNDDFAYNYADPTSVMPRTAFGGNQAFHNDPNVDGDVELRYDLASPVTVAATTNIVVDLYGRNSSKDRDDDIDIQFLDANDNVLGEVLGAGIDDNTDHVRVSSLDANLAIGAVVAKIRLIAHDTDSDPAEANSFTLQEIRAALLSDSDGDATDNVFPHDGSVNVTNITVTGTPFQSTNPGGAVTLGTTSANGTRIDGVYGTLTIGADGSYVYTLDPTTSDSLAALEEVDEIFTYTIEDGNEDGGMDDVTATLTIAVTGTNDAPVVTADSVTLQENSPDGTFVHQVVAADADAGATLTYAITAGNTDSAFAIDPGTGEITVNSTAALDFETNPSFSLTVSVTDDQSVTTNETITVALQDIPNLVFVDDTFAGTANGAAISDADFGANGNQGATFGVNAFATIQEAIDAVEDDGVIIINSGTYAETISLADGKTIEITGPDTAGAVAIDSLTSATGTEVILEGASTLTIGGSNASSTLDGLISGSGGLIKTGTGTLTLNGANTNTGSLLLDGGRLSATNSGALGSGTVTLDGGILRTNVDLANDIVLNDTTTTTSNTIEVNGNYHVLSGQLSGPGGFTLNNVGGGADGLALSNSANDFLGDVTITGANTFLRLDANEVLPDTANVLVDVGGKLRLEGDGRTETIAGLSGEGRIFGSNTGSGPTLRVGSANATSEFAGQLGGGGQNNRNISLEKIGLGILTLSGSLSDHTGTTTISSGTLIVNGTHTDGGSYTISSGATLAGDGEITLATGNLVFASGNLATGDPDVASGIGTLTITNDQINLNGPIDYQISGATSDTLEVIGAVQIGSSAVLSISDIVDGIDGTTYTVVDNDGTDAIINTFQGLPEGAVIVDSENNFYTISYVGGDGNDIVLVKTFTTVYVDDSLSGSNNGDPIADADLGTSGNQEAVFGENAFATIQEAIDAVATNGTIIINDGIYAEAISLEDGKTIEITGPDAGGIVAIDSLATLAGTEVIIEGTSTLSVGASNATTEIAGTISGSGNFEKQGTGDLTLSGANSYAGTTNVAAGILVVANDTALGAATGNTTVGTTFNDSARLHFTGGITVAEDINLTGGNSGVVRNVSGDNTITGEITLNGNSDFRRNAGRMTISGGVTSAANQNLSLNGVFTVDTLPIDLNNGRLTITSNGNSLANANILNVGGNEWGQTRISFSGYLLVGGENFLPSDTAVSIGHSANAGQNRGTLDLGGFDQTIASIETTFGALDTPSDQTITGGGTLTVNLASGTEEYQGRITDGATPTNLVLNGAGILILENLSGNANTYTGTTTINGGTLALEADTQIDQSSEIAIASGATFDVTARTSGDYTYAGDLTGTGTVAGALTIGAGGNIQPGTNSGDNTGTLALTGDTTISGDYEFTVDGATTDLIIVEGGVTLGGTLTFNVLNDPIASTIVVIENDATDPITTFFGQADGSIVQVGSKLYTLSYSGGDGNDVVLTEFVPTVVYVDDNFAGTTPGDTIADADLGTNGSQAAIFGASAFATLGEAIAAVADNGTIIVNAGSYAENVVLADGKIIEITGPDGVALVSIDSLTTASGTEVIIEGTSTLTVGAGNADSTLAGVVSGSGNLTKAGTGTVTLSGANTYTGTTTLAAGTLVADAADVAATSGALGNGGDVTFTGGTLRYTANSAATDYSARIVNSTSEISLDTNGQDVTLAEDIANTNNGGLTKLGLGELIVEFDSDYTGLTSVNGGTLELFNDDVFNAGWRGDNKGNFAVNNGSTLEFNNDGGNREIFQRVNFTFDANGGGTIDFVSGGFIFQDFGVGNTFTTNGGAKNTIRSTDNSILNLQFSNRLIFDVADGTDEIDLEFGARINDGEIIKNGAGTLAVTNSANNLGVDTNGGTVPNTVTINAGTLELAEDGRLQSGDFAGEIINEGIFRHNSTADQILSGVISGSGDLVKANIGVLELSGDNTYTGLTTIQSGLVKLSSFTALGASTNAANGTVVESGGALDLNGQRTRLTERITINGDGLSGDPDSGALFNGSGVNMVNDGVQFLTLGSDASIGNAGNASAGRFGLNAGTIDGAFTLTKVGGNAVWLSSNVTVANLVIEDGFYGVQGDNALNNIAGTVTIEDDGTLATFSDRNLNADIISNDGTIQTNGSGGVGAISLGGTLELTGIDNILNNTGDTILTINSVVSGTGGLVKNGSGQAILTGNNTFSGPTTVNAAILTVNGSNTGGGAYTVVSGATLEGDGSITGDVTSQTGSVVSAGDDLGDLAITGAVNVGGQYLFEFNGNNATRDLLDVTGTVTLGAASTLDLVDLDDILTPAATGTIVLIQNDGTDPVVGNFMGLAEGATVADDDGGQYTISYFGGDGNDVVLFVGTPETLVSFAGGTLTISDIASDSADALDISYDSGTDEYVITDPNLNLGTAGLGDGQFSRPDVNTVRIDASIVTGLVIDTVNATTDASADTVTLASLPPTALAGDVSIAAETINLDTSISTTGGDITLTGATTLSTDTVLDATNVSLLGAVDLGASDLTIDVTGNAGVSTGGISGTGDLIKDGTGRFTMDGTGSPTNSYSGLTLVREGDLEVGGSFATDGAIQGDITVEDGGTLRLLQNEIIAGTTDLTIESGGTVNWNFRVEAIGSLNGAGDIVNNTNFQGITLDEIDGTHTFSGTISGFNGNPAGGIVIRGNEDNSGTQVFSGATLDIANFVVADGTATITNDTVVNNTGGTTVGTNRITGIDTGNTTGVLNIESGTFTTASFNSGDRQANTVIGTINQTGGTVTTTGVITQDNAGIRLGHFPNSTSTYNLSGGALEVQAGDIAIGINGNGVFNQNGGTLTAPSIVVNARDAAGTGAANLTGGTLNLGVGGISTTGGPAVLTLGGDGYTITPTADTSITADGTLQGTDADALTLNTDSFDITISSVLSGAGGLAKTGAEELILTGDNTYLGATYLNEGTLTIDGVIGNGAPADTLTIAGGATLAGSGRVNAMIAVNSGTVSPGDDDGDVTNTLSVNDLNFGTGTFTVDLDGATDSDQLDVTGAVDLATSTLVINSATDLAFGTTVTLVSNDGADPILSTFDGLPEGTRFTDGTNTFVISYRGGDGNDITLSVINPNPPVVGGQGGGGTVAVTSGPPRVFSSVTDSPSQRVFASDPFDDLLFGDNRFSQDDLLAIQNSFRDLNNERRQIFGGFRFNGIANDGQPFNLFPEDPRGQLTDFFDSGEPAFNLSPFFSGVVEPGASIIVQISNEFGIPIAEVMTTASLTGDWYATFPGEDFAGGDYRVDITVISVDFLGNTLEELIQTVLPSSSLVLPDLIQGLTPGDIFGATLEIQAADTPAAAVSVPSE